MPDSGAGALKIIDNLKEAARNYDSAARDTIESIHKLGNLSSDQTIEILNIDERFRESSYNINHLVVYGISIIGLFAIVKIWSYVLSGGAKGAKKRISKSGSFLMATFKQAKKIFKN